MLYNNWYLVNSSLLYHIKVICNCKNWNCAETYACLWGKAMGALDNALVVSLEHAVAAPYASCKLADAGARVIKVERPEGDFARQYDHLVNGLSAYFVWLNRGKESIALNLKNETDKHLLTNMIGEADVFIQNLGPGVVEKLGFGAEDLSVKYPNLITCCISGYGSFGPAQYQKAYDLLIQAETGLSAINGVGDAPARVGLSICDISAGMTAYQAILEAFIERNVTGVGRNIEVSLFHATADWMNVPYLQFKYGGRKPARAGLMHPTIAPYGAFMCKDKKVILIAIQNEREWQSFCANVLKKPEVAILEDFASNTKRVENRVRLDGLVQSFFESRDLLDNLELLNAADIAYGKFSEMEDFVDHPQNNFMDVKTQSGVVKMLAPADWTEDQRKRSISLPELNEHADKIRSDFS